MRVIMESLRLSEGDLLVVGEINSGQLPSGEVVEALKTTVIK